ncbi:hypothetical protein CEXT_411921 [Caerostris extrusa]|uniref:Uncharacterized protein n=1 Tax=Caerostris extrusa TaxID=172846 RepID=A0AAV4SMW4_CAEEX|nr:hypothetical protein CEXT_411921 [Caerostris extrusa]
MKKNRYAITDVLKRQQKIAPRSKKAATEAHGNDNHFSEWTEINRRQNIKTSFIGRRELLSADPSILWAPLRQFLYPGTLDEVQNLPPFITILVFFSGYEVLVQSRAPVCV